MQNKLLDNYLGKRITTETAEDIVNIFANYFNGKKVVIWGASGTGKLYGELFIRKGINIECFVDKNAEIVKTLFALPVYTSDFFIENNSDQYSVILAGSVNTVNLLKKEINEKNINNIEYIDGAEIFDIMQDCERIMRVGYYSWEDDVSSGQVTEQDGVLSIPFFELVVTTFCSLRCKHCAHFNAHYYFLPEGKEKLKHFPVEEVLDTVDRILESVDEVREFSVVGGEPFLYPQLTKVLKVLNENTKVKRVEVATNGTLLPKNNVLEQLKNKKVYVTISDYGDVSKKTEALAILLNNNGVSNRVQVQGYGWDDLGDHYDRGRNIEDMKKTYADCFDTRYKLILGKKIYACHRVANADNLNFYDSESSEVIDVFSYDSNKLREKIKQMYQLEHIPYCNYCNGKGELVVAAQQYTHKEIKELREKYKKHE